VVQKATRETGENVQQFKSNHEFVGLYDIKSTIGKYVAMACSWF
jgi:hypothetical protein